MKDKTNHYIWVLLLCLMCPFYAFAQEPVKDNSKWGNIEQERRHRVEAPERVVEEKKVIKEEPPKPIPPKPQPPKPEPPKPKVVVEKKRPEQVKTTNESIVSFGIRAGLNMATTKFGDSYDETGMTIGFHFGVIADIKLTEMLYFTPGLLYSGKGYKYDKIETASASYVDIPLVFSARFGDIDQLQFQVNAGPYVAMGVGGKIKSEKNDSEKDFFDYYKGFDYGLSVGGGILISCHYYVGLSLQVGFADYRNQNISIGIGYNF